MKALVIGGAGFIGSHIVDGLLSQGHKVRVMDNLDPQVHGDSKVPPSYLSTEAEFVLGDVLNREDLRKALQDIEVVYYKAAAVGVGQSMYDIRRYVEVNSLGAANLLDVIVNDKIDLKKIIVASSMSIYGEGTYQSSTGEVVTPQLRSNKQLAEKQWEYLDASGSPLAPLPTSENKPLYPTSVYAITKRDHEELFLSVGNAYDIPVVALRYFNVYGQRQALSNPYTGVAAIFSSLILNGKAPLIYEDGEQTRDFVHVSDVVQANLLALQKDAANGKVFNIGSGKILSIMEIANTLCEQLDSSCEPIITGEYRAGDIRHCFADISKAQEVLGYNPQVLFRAGISELANWVSEQIAIDRVSESRKELAEKNLLI